MPFPATHPALARALEAQGYEQPTPVQAAVLEAPSNSDLLVSAQTGSGKTVAFGLAAAEPLMGAEERFGPAGAPLALVIAPTRELALQVSRELTWLYKETGAVVATCVGGMDPRTEQRRLAAGVHIVVGTPGRLKDHLERGNLDCSSLKVVVLDEADEMLDMGFREDLEEILDAAPTERRTFLFSATLARDIVALARRYQTDAFRIDTIRRDEPHGDIEYRAIRVGPSEVENAVVNLLRFFESPGALIFCATREGVRHLYGALRERGFSAVHLSGELSQKDRSEALQALRDGTARACVATDVAARGLDLPDLGLVIHADLPTNKAGLLHRSGRTGRAGKKGVSVVVVPHTRRRRAEQLFASAGLDVTWGGAPTADEIRARDQQRMFDDPLLSDAPTDDEIDIGKKLLLGRSPEAIAAALVRLYRSRLPEPEEMLEQRPDERADYGARIEKRYSDGSGKDAVWFRIPVGRSKNADPKWLLPLICRIGHVTKKDIGSIRIFGAETRFEIFRDAEAKFRAAAKAAAETGEMKVEETIPPDAEGVVRKLPEHKHRPGQRGGFKPGGPADRGPPRERAAPPADGERPAFGRSGKVDSPPEAGRPFEKKPYEKKPYEGKPREDRPAREGKSFGKKRFEPDLGRESFGDGAPKRKPFSDKPPGKGFGDKPSGKAFGGKPGGKPFSDKPKGPRKFKK